MTRKNLQVLIENSIKELQKEKALPAFNVPEIKLEHPENKDHGDYATNIAMVLAELSKMAPKEAASLLALKLKKNGKLLEKVELADPGFINFFISKDHLKEQVKEILKQKDRFGSLGAGATKKVNVEFISANPTGPLHVGNGRGGFCGDALANVLKKAGHKALREYYINDRGRQIKFLKNSLAGKEPSYKNEYIEDLKKKGVRDEKRAVKYIVQKIKKTAKEMGIIFDKWFFESELYPREAKEVLKLLKKKNLVFEKEEALWFKSEQFGDDKNRVLVRAEEKTTYERETYILSDLAYMKNKFKRGFDELVIFLGAEHHSYASRLKAGAQALGCEPAKIKPIVMQLVRLTEEGKEVKMSKRTGSFVTIDELLDEVGKDVARFLFLTKNYGSHLVFDLSLAKRQSEKNPVFYVQYAHARLCSILRKAKPIEIKPQQLKLEHPSELSLVKFLIRLPEIVEDTAKDYQVQRLPQYAIELATSFHKFYQECRVISDDKELTRSRLALVMATKTILKNILDLMGITAPEKM